MRRARPKNHPALYDKAALYSVKNKYLLFIENDFVKISDYGYLYSLNSQTMKNILYCFFVCLFVSGISAQTTYYVSTSGNDSNAGTLSSPWRTIQKAANTAGAGSTVLIREGVYFEKVEMNKNGTSTAYITYRNYPGETVTLDGTGVIGASMIGVYNKRYLKIIGLNITNNIQNDASGVLIEYGSRNIELRNCVISNIHFSANPNDIATANKNAHPVLVYGDHPTNISTGIIVDSCEIRDCRTGYSEGLTMDGNVSGFRITRNYVHHISNIGIDMAGHFGACPTASLDQARSGICSDNYVAYCGSNYATAAGIYVDGGKNIVIERNRIERCQWGIEVGCENIGKTSSGITVRDNLVWRCAQSGLTFGGYDYPSGSGRITGCKFLNNTFFQNDTTGQSQGQILLTASATCQFKNNIVVGIGQWLMSRELTASGLVMNYNVWYTPTGTGKVQWGSTTYATYSAYKTGTGLDANSLFANPMLGADLHISSGSVAINAGDPTFVAPSGETDIDGQTRVQLNRVDCGADEVSTVLLQQPLSDATVQTWPNPATDIVHLQLSEPSDVIITDIYGQIFFKAKTTTQTDIRCAYWPKGVYTLQTISLDGRIASKVIVLQ